MAMRAPLTVFGEATMPPPGALSGGEAVVDALRSRLHSIYEVRFLNALTLLDDLMRTCMLRGAMRGVTVLPQALMQGGLGMMAGPPPLPPLEPLSPPPCQEQKWCSACLFVRACCVCLGLVPLCSSFRVSASVPSPAGPRPATGASNAS